MSNIQETRKILESLPQEEIKQIQKLLDDFPRATPLLIGGLVFPGIDQLDFTGPFEVLASLSNSKFHTIWKDTRPVRDIRGLQLTPDTTLADAPALDVLLIPGGLGQFPLMEDEEVLDFIRKQAQNAKIVFSVCTGSLTLGAAGLLRGVKCTTHWASFEVLSHLGAIPVNERVVVDGKFVSAAGVTSGIDGALRVVALLRGDRAAQMIQLAMQYAPEPPFKSGGPDTAPPEVLAAARQFNRELLERRLVVAARLSKKWRDPQN